MKPTSRRSRVGLSSVYGFIMIYLLVIASLQALSSALSSNEGAMAAAQEAGQVEQMRSLEHLQVTTSPGGNVTVTNDGLIPSTLSLLLVRVGNTSRVLPVRDSLAVGASIELEAGPDPSSHVAVVTSLGDVFEAQSGQASPSPGTVTLDSPVGGPGLDAQVYQNPAYPGTFFLAQGPLVSEYSASTGSPGWSFDTGQGEVTDVLPLSSGQVYVSDGYYGDQFTSNLFELSSGGTSIATFSMRLLRLYTTVEVQFPNGGLPPYPVGSQPVQKGLDSLYAYYDGWFFSSSGPSSTTVPSDTDNLAASDSGDFYVYAASEDAGGYGCAPPRGNYVTVYGYSTGSQEVAEQWYTTFYFGICDLYPDDLLASAAGSGVVALVFSETYWSQTNYYAGPYEGSNPFLLVLSSSSGATLKSGQLDANGYTSVATDGADLYLAIPSADQVEVLPASGTGGGTFFDVGVPASTLLWADGSLFAISQSQVNVYSPSMALENEIDFSPLTFYSLSNSKQLEPQMIQPSFLVLNSTAYVALLRNSTGYGSLVEGSYAG